MLGRACLVGLAACGRIDFDELDATGRISLTVLANDPSGIDSPIEGAYVLLDDDTLERTDAAGRLAIPAATPRTFHVVHPIATGWRVTSLFEIPSATAIDLGPRTQTGRAATPYTIDFPLVGGAGTMYELAVSPRCETGNGVVRTSTSPFTFMVADECRGERLMVHALALPTTGALGQQTSIEIAVDAGTASIPSWGAAPGFTTMTVHAVPATTTEMYVTGLRVFGNDVLNGGQVRVDPPYPDPVVLNDQQRLSATGLGVFLIDANANATSSFVGPTLELTAGQLLPYTSSVLSLGDRSLAWEPVPGVDVQRFEFRPESGTGTEWFGYAPSGRGQAVFPVLPPELAEADAGTRGSPWAGVTNAIDVLGTGTSDVIRVVDREWPFWNVWGGRLPVGGFRVSGVTTAVLP